MRKSIIVIVLIVLSLSLASLSGCNKIVEEKITLYEMDIEFNSTEMTLLVSQFVTYYNDTESNLEELVFHLYPNAFSEQAELATVSERLISSAYYSGMSYGGIEIFRAESDKSVLEFEVDKEILRVDIPTLKPKEGIKVFLRYRVDLPKVKHRFGYNDDTVNLGNFYPQLAVFENGEYRTDSYSPYGDPFYSDIADYRINLKIDKDYKIASSGRAIADSMNIITKTIRIEADNVRDFAMVFSKKFNIISNTVNDITVNYYYYKDAEPEISLASACSALHVFQDIIGEYPYDTYTVVETEFVHGGMEYPQLVMISSSVTGTTRDRVIVHETAHQWWYALVGNDSINSAWMDEGLTEFVTAMYYGEIGEGGKMRDLINTSFSSYLLFNDVRLTVQLANDTSMRRSLNDFNSDYEYVTMIYTKGMLMFSSIYEIIGRDAFVEGMRNYYDKYRYKNAGEKELIREFELASGKPLNKLFDSWLSGKVAVTTYRAA